GLGAARRTGGGALGGTADVEVDGALGDALAAAHDDVVGDGLALVDLAGVLALVVPDLGRDIRLDAQRERAEAVVRQRRILGRRAEGLGEEGREAAVVQLEVGQVDAALDEVAGLVDVVRARLRVERPDGVLVGGVRDRAAVTSADARTGRARRDHRDAGAVQLVDAGDGVGAAGLEVDLDQDVAD